MQKTKIVFMGTPEFAAYILNQLCLSNGCEVAAIYTQPDRPAGRGKKLVFSAVKQCAQKYDIPIEQPLNFKNPQDIELLRSFNPDLLVVAAYGIILPQEVLDIPKIAPLNVHASLLPLYRGAAPIQRAIMDGQQQSGVSIMHMEASLDTGPVYAVRSINIDEHNAGSLHDCLARLGSELLIEVINDMQKTEILPVEQNHANSTYAKKLSKSDSIIDWNCSAANIHAHIRGVTPWPGVQLSVLRPEKENLVLKVKPGSIGRKIDFYAKLMGVDPSSILPAQIWRLEKDIIGISCNDNFYILDEVCPLNKNYMSAADFARGYLESKLGFLASVTT